MTYLSVANSARSKSSTQRPAKRRGVFSTFNQWELWIFRTLYFMHRVQSNEEKQTARQIHEFCVNNWVQYTPTLLPDVAGFCQGWMENAECGVRFLLCKPKTDVSICAGLKMGLFFVFLVLLFLVSTSGLMMIGWRAAICRQ